MEKEQYRLVIRFLFLEGKSRSEIKKRLDAVYGDSSASMATVKNWFNEFQRGRTSVFDETRPDAPKTATTEDNVTKIHDLVSQNDHRALLCRIIGPIRRRSAEKSALFGEEKSALPPWQCTGSHYRRRHGQISRIRLRTAAPSTVFSRFGAVRLLFVSKLESHSPGRNLSRMRRLSLPRRPTLQTSRKRIFQTG